MDARRGGPGIGARWVLVVDDHTESRESLALWLERHGWRVDGAAAGPEALRLAERRRPTVALLDLDLPGMDGFELALGLRALPGLGGLRLVATTGLSDPETLRRVERAPFEAFLSKPIDLERLERLLSPVGSMGPEDPTDVGPRGAIPNVRGR